MQTIRWGIIGVGDVTEVKSGPGFQKADNSELVAVMRRTGDLARDYAERHNVPRWYDDANALIHDDEVDAVYIATPPHVHKEYVLRCAEAGKPVYCEKPMALNHTECVEMNNACSAASVPLWVAYYRRTLPSFVMIKELVETGRIGDVHTVTTRVHTPPLDLQDGAEIPWRFMPDIAGGGKFVDLGSHQLDYLDYLLGPIADVNGYAVNRMGSYPAEDNVVASFQFESGVLGSGSWSFCSTEQADETILYGTKGQIAFACFADAPFTLQTADGVQEIHLPYPQHVHQPLIQTVVNELNGQGECPSTGISGARTNAVMDEILKGYYEA